MALKGILVLSSPVACRDRIVVSTLRCGRSNLGSNPSHGTLIRHSLTAASFLLRLETCTIVTPQSTRLNVLIPGLS